MWPPIMQAAFYALSSYELPELLEPQAVLGESDAQSTLLHMIMNRLRCSWL